MSAFKQQLKVINTVRDSLVSQLVIKVHGGSRYAPKVGLSHLLSRFNFQNTNDKSSLRSVREMELTGGIAESYVDREYITLRASFLKENLPYFVQSLGNVLYRTSFKEYELNESVLPAASYDLFKANKDPYHKANDLLYNTIFRSKSGLGNPIYYDQVEDITLDDVKNFSNKVYTKSNLEIIGKNLVEADLIKFIDDSPINELAQGYLLSDQDTVPLTYEGESRFRTPEYNVLGIGIPFKENELVNYQLLANYLNSSLFEGDKRHCSASIDTYHGKYGVFKYFHKDQDPVTLTTQFKQNLSVLKFGIDLSKVLEITKLNNFELLGSVKSSKFTPKSFKLSKFNFVAIGDTTRLPYLSEL